MRSPALIALLVGAAPLGYSAGFLEGSAVEQSIRHPGPVQRVVVEGRYLEVDVDGVSGDGLAARALVSSKFQERNDFELQIAVGEGRVSIGFAVNDRPSPATPSSGARG